MSKEIINIMNDMADYLDASQMKRLKDVLVWRLSEEEMAKTTFSNKEYLEMFLTAKKLEGCSDKTILYYRFLISKMLESIDAPVIKISTCSLRKFLVDYQEVSSCSKVSMDNLRRVLSSFFSWLEEEDHILKNPVKRIHKVKATQKVKHVIADEDIESLRDGCGNIRDLAIMDFLLSTGIRVGELVKLDIRDVDFERRECVVYGKGDKERTAYFDAKSKIHLQEYLESRTDDNPALFVSLRIPYNRMTTHSVEIRLHSISSKLDIDDIHPHKFRRTMATKAIEKGMPIEQVQKLLGHQQIDTTLQYAMVNQDNVKISHKKFMG